MTNGPRMLVVQPDGTTSVGYLPPRADDQLPVLHEIIGGWLEGIGIPGQWHAYLNEEGKLHGLDFNEAAQAIAIRLGWTGPDHGDFLVGPVVFLGSDGSPDETDVPETVLVLARGMGLIA